MICPFGKWVGERGELALCPLGFPGCACADEIIMEDTDQADEQSYLVTQWWKDHAR